MQDLLFKLKDIWTNTTSSNRLLLGSAVVAVIGVAIGFMMWAGRPEYSVLVSGPADTEVKQILAYLKERKITPEYSPDGKTISVPSSVIHDVTMELNGRGLMRTGKPGYALLDNMPLQHTQEWERVAVIRAVEGELENAIQTLQQVSLATVKIAEGKQTGFVDDKQETTASVLVHLKPGYNLEKENVRAIVNLVARAKSGLTEKSISVIDGEGALLWDGSQVSGSVGDSEERFEHERAFREAVARDIRGMIEKTVGPDKSAVIVQAVLNLDHTEQNSIEYTPGPEVYKSKSSETYQGGSSAGSTQGAGGPAGADANSGAPDPGTVDGQSNAGKGGSSKTMNSGQDVTKMENSRKEVRTIRTPGEVKNLAVAIQLDQKIDPEVVTAIRTSAETIAKTYLADATQIPNVSVVQVPFDQTRLEDAKKTAAASASAEQMSKLLGYGVPIGLMLLMLFILARSLKPSAARQLIALPGQSPQLALAGVGAYGGDGAVGLPGMELVPRHMDDGMGGAVDPTGMSVEEALSHGTKAPIGILPDDVDERQFQVIQEAFDADLASITHLAKTKPEIIAVLIRTWMSDERR